MEVLAKFQSNRTKNGRLKQAQSLENVLSYYMRARRARNLEDVLTCFLYIYIYIYIYTQIYQ